MKTGRRSSRGTCDFEDVIEYLKHAKYPNGMSDGEKRSLRKRSKSFRVDGSRLFYLGSRIDCKDPLVSDKQDRLVLITKEHRMQAIAEAHVDERGVHLGREKATAIISKKYYWVGISHMVRDYARSCSVCRANRITQNQMFPVYRTPAPLKEEEDWHDVETASTMSSSFVSTTSEQTDDMELSNVCDLVSFGELVEVYVMGPYKCQKSSRYVVVFLDMFSGWPEVYLLDKVTPADMTHLVLQWTCRFGVIQNLLIKDCGKCSWTQCEPLTKVLQDNGLFDLSVHSSSSVWNLSVQWTEIKEALTSFIENNDCWDKCVEFALLSLRISRGKEAEYTPSYLTYSREFRLPTYLSHREEASPSNTGLDPHLTPDQMKGSADKLVQLYREYARDMGKEYKELIIQAVSETDFKVPLAGPSDRSAKNSGRKRRLSQVIDDGESIGEDGDNSYYVVSLNDNNQDVTSSMKKQKQKPTQPRRAARQIKREKDTEEVDDEGDSYFEKYTSEKSTLDTFYRALLLYVREKTYPPGCEEHLKRAVRQAHTSYTVDKEQLMYTTRFAGKKKRIVTTLRERMALLKSTHVDTDGKHMSVRHVTNELSDVYWRAIGSDCQAFVSACPACDIGTTVRGKKSAESSIMARIRKNEKIAADAEKHYSLLIQYLQKSKFLPSAGNQERAAVLNICDHFKLVKGVLFLSSTADDAPPMCVEVASRARKMAIKSAHTSTGSKVPTCEELCWEVSQKYIWNGLSLDVSHYLSSLGTPDSQEDHTPGDGSHRLPHVEKKRLDFLGYFENEEEFFEKYESKSDGVETCDPLVDADTGVSGDIEDFVENTSVRSQEVGKVGSVETAEADSSKDTDTEVGLSNYVSNSSNKVYVVSTSRNPSETEAITVHIEEMESNVDKNSQESSQEVKETDEIEDSAETNKEDVIQTKTQFAGLDKGGLVHLANALAFVSDPQTEAAVQSIMEDSGKAVVKQTRTVKLPLVKKESISDVKSDATDTVPSRVRQGPISKSEGIQVKSDATGEDACDDSESVKSKKSCVYTCTVCDKVIRGNVKFRVHMYKHDGVKPFACDHCNKKFTNTKSRRLHMRKHTGIAPYLCSLCGKSFTLIGSLKAHIKIHEKGGNVKTTCTLCDRVFASKNRYDRHMHYKHPQSPPVHKCESCNKFFTTSRSLRRHTMSFHLNVKYHLCGVCGKSFYRKEYLTSHLSQHGAVTSMRKVPRKRESTKTEHEMVRLHHTEPTERQHIQHLESTGLHRMEPLVLLPAGVQQLTPTEHVRHSELQNMTSQTGIQHMAPTVVQHLNSSVGTPTLHETLHTYHTPHMVATGEVAADNVVPVTLYSNSPVQYTDSSVQVENTFYAIENQGEEDEQQVATVVYGYPAVQYEVECSSGADQLDSDALSAINLLAQASASQGGDSITYVAQSYQ